MQAPLINLSMGKFGDADLNGEADNWPIIEGPEIKEVTDIDEPDESGSNAGKSSGSGSLFFLLLLAPFIKRRP